MRAILKRFAKPLVAGALTLCALGAHYLSRWDPQPNQPASHRLLTTRSGHSPMMLSRDTDASVWRIAVATNRDLVTGGIRKTPAPSGASLVEQTKHIRYQVGQTTFGFVDATVPRVRERGRCRFGTDAGDDSTIHLTDLDQTPPEEFMTRLVGRASECDDVLVFVHGFNVRFEHSIARAAQIAEDMPFDGLIVNFSWASSAGGNRLLVNQRYARDEAVAERYFWSLGRLLADLKACLPSKTRLHLLAHSMGNRVALRALNALAGRMTPMGDDVLFPPAELKQRFPRWGKWRADQVSEPLLAEVVFAAPDVDAEEFERLAANVSHVARQLTLYSSDVDLALEGSLKFNGEGYRAGDSRARVRLPGLRVVRTSRVSRLDPLGHSYYGSDPRVLDNLATLFGSDAARPGQMTVGEFARRAGSVPTRLARQTKPLTGVR